MTKKSISMRFKKMRLWGKSNSALETGAGETAESGRLLTDESLRLNFPIDVVYTWVDASDPHLIDVLKTYRSDSPDPNVSDPARFASHDELKYSLRSLDYFAPWINRIFIVTCNQRPAWLNDHPKVCVVSHEEILQNRFLPTFNSHVIESSIHRIPGLSEHYIYFNDDVLLMKPLSPLDAFSGNGLSYGFLTDVFLDSTPGTTRDTATVRASKNARDLINREWGKIIPRRFAHSFQPQRKSVAEECERLFSVEYEAFRSQRFRSAIDILCCGYLHPVASYLMGKGLLAYTNYWYVKVRNHRILPFYEQMLSERDKPWCRLAACLNDTVEKKEPLEGYSNHLKAFLETYYPISSRFESP